LHSASLFVLPSMTEGLPLTVLEAMACGTPVMAFRGGSVEEIIEDGVTGFVVGDLDEAVKAVSKLDSIDRAVCRSAFEERFSSARMCRDYVRAYGRVVGNRRLSVDRTLRLQKHELGASVADVVANAE